MELQNQLQTLLARAGFLLRKWMSSSEPDVLQHIEPHLLGKEPYHGITELYIFTKVLRIEWDSQRDIFHLAIGETPSITMFTKRALVSYKKKNYDILGWLGSNIIKLRILLQRMWEAKLGWDEVMPQEIHEHWNKWRNEFTILRNQLIL